MRSFHFSRRMILDLIRTAAILLIAAAVSILLVKWTDSSANVAAVFTLAVLLVSRTAEGYGWGIFASIAGVFAVNFAFTAPYYKFNFTSAGYPIIFISLLLISVITSASTGNIKRQASQARASEQRTRKLYDFSQQLAAARNGEEMVRLTLNYLYELLERPVLFLKNADGLRNDEEYICGKIPGFISDAVEQTAAAECFREKEDTGAGLLLSPYSRFRYIPVKSGETMFGAVGLLWNAPEPDEKTMSHIRAILAQTGVSLERYQLSEDRNRAAMAVESEKIRNNLLRSISHDLRTPLTGIIGASGVIEESGDRIGAAGTRKLAANIREDAEWLLRMVENLLSVTRVSQAGKIKKSEEAVEEVVAEAVRRCRKRFPGAQIRVQLPEEMVFAPMDATLVMQVLINLIENAVRYAGTPIDISIRRQGTDAEFTVRDFGPGIEQEKQKTLFMSAQTQPDSRGLGIGLTLCHSIITAHGGTIYETNHPDGGAQFVFTLPLEEEK